MNYALIFAGGTGQRMKSNSKPKQFLCVDNKPIIIHTIEIFDHHPKIDGIIVVCLKDWIDELKQLLVQYSIKKVKWIVAGGSTGQESIRNGLFTLYNEVDKDAIVLIHDGVRPLINDETITNNIITCQQYGNAITAVPSIETIVTVNDQNEISGTIDRNSCFLARAPQTFVLSNIVDAHKKAIEKNELSMIDSATLMKWYGCSLHIVLGPVENIKITTPMDFYLFKSIYKMRGAEINVEE